MPGGSILGRGWERGLEIEREVGTEGSSWSLSGNWDEEVEMRSWSVGEDGNRTRAAWRVTDKLGGEMKISVCNHLSQHFYSREASTQGPWPLWEGGTLPDFSTEIQPGFLGLLLLANCCRLPGQSASSPPSPYKIMTLSHYGQLCCSLKGQKAGKTLEMWALLRKNHHHRLQCVSILPNYFQWCEDPEKSKCFLQTLWKGGILIFPCGFTSRIETLFSWNQNY